MKMIRNHWVSASLLGLTWMFCGTGLAQSEQEVEASQTTDSATEVDAETDPRIERIEIRGRRWLPETTTAEGSFTLSREFLDNALKGNGNVTDMLLFLPGVQGAEGALSADRQGEIKSQLISVSGAQPWQTSFVLDGLDNNSYLDPGSSRRSVTAINDVQGHPEASFVNHELIGSVTLYDSNVPARFGAFNGGVVDMELRDAQSAPTFTLDYRRSNSGWGSYHYIDDRRYNEDAEAAAQQIDWPREPEFDKESLTFSLSHQLSDRQSLMLSVARTTSTITDISLNKAVQTERESVSTSLSYQLDDMLFDRLRFNLGYSPYSGRHLIKDVLDSEFDLDGGGMRASVGAWNSLWGGQWQAKLAWSQSENSRQAPNVFLPWYRAAGKDWGIDQGSPPFSMQGGYGDLDKTQTSWSATTDFSRELDAQWLGARHSFELGLGVERMLLRRQRPQTSAVYSAPFRDASVQCGGQTLDCIEQSYRMSLDELAAELGGQIDFSNPDHIQAYQDNLLTRGQFMRYRRLYLSEDIEVILNQANAYAEYHFDWPRLQLTLGGRSDYDDFLENLNLAYRTRASWDLFGNDMTRLNAGFNRYYAANLVTYQLREAQRPYLTQYRPISNGEVAGWITSSSAARYRYRFDDVRTPYSDEVSVGINQRLWHNAMLTLRYVQRRGYDQITRGPQEYIDGYTYLYQTNEGSNRHDRVSLSLNQAWQNHSLTFNINYTDNESSAESYDDTVLGVPEDELVVLRRQIEVGDEAGTTYQLMSYDDLTRRQMDFSRPLTANLVWNASWLEAFSSTLSLAYVGEFESVIDTGILYEMSRGDVVCDDCDLQNLTYPLFDEYERPARVSTNARLEYRLGLSKDWSAALNLEINNLFNQRTHLVSPGAAGIEVGREFWLGVNVRW
ncbi:hypothetical protein CWE12_08525 [Aliidiomarina sedimenti]|uniref:TonB-dependent receptor plug domain-containing protein n=2 Tax=Aliidiomarina sedimenti TaxID=1933879 RepID=A0ABY0BZQ8_9GAMM|nr:hypothetical protein CWE12_08525 [Aliidiomarina sedimenti]